MNQKNHCLVIPRGGGNPFDDDVVLFTKLVIDVYIRIILSPHHNARLAMGIDGQAVRNNPFGLGLSDGWRDTHRGIGIGIHIKVQEPPIFFSHSDFAPFLDSRSIVSVEGWLWLNQ